MKIALVQLTSSGNMAANIAAISAFVRDAAREGAALVSLPETAHLMVLGREKALSLTHMEDEDPGLKALCSLAGELGIWLHVGSLIIRKPGDRLANRAFLIGPDGGIVARYDKLHLFDVDLGGGEAYRESALYDAGDSPVLAETPLARLGLSICYDLRFPHLYTALARAGAQVIMVPAAFTVPTGQAHWHALLRARAIETGCWVVASAQTGAHDTGRSTFGHSLVVSPWGEVVADAGIEPGIITVDLDLQKCEEARSRIPNLNHVRDLPAVTVVENGQ